MRLASVNACGSCFQSGASSSANCLRFGEVQGAFVDRAPRDRPRDAFTGDRAERTHVVEIPDPSRSDDRHRHLTRQTDRRLDVRSAHHPVPADVGEDEGFHPVALEAPGEIGGIVIGQLRPSVDGDLPVPGVEADDDVAGKLDAEIGDEVRCRGCPRPQDDEPHAGLDVCLHRVLVADPPPTWTGTSGCASTMARTTPAFFGSPAAAPSRSTMWSRRAPASTQRVAIATGSSENTVAVSMRPSRRRTHLRSLMSMAGMRSMLLVSAEGQAGDRPLIRFVILPRILNQMPAKMLRAEVDRMDVVWTRKDAPDNGPRESSLREEWVRRQGWSGPTPRSASRRRHPVPAPCPA